jgi:hypothetical protein
LGNVKFQVTSLLGLEVGVDSAFGELLHCEGVVRVELDQARDGVDVLVNAAGLVFQGGKPLGELRHELRFVVLELLLFVAKAAAKQVVRQTAQTPTAFVAHARRLFHGDREEGL